MSAASSSRSERPAETPEEEFERRENVAAGIVAEGLLTLLVRERLAELDTRDEEAHAQTAESLLPVAGRASSSAVFTARAESPSSR